MTGVQTCALPISAHFCQWTALCPYWLTAEANLRFCYLVPIYYYFICYNVMTFQKHNVCLVLASFKSSDGLVLLDQISESNLIVSGILALIHPSPEYDPWKIKFSDLLWTRCWYQSQICGGDWGPQWSAKVRICFHQLSFGFSIIFNCSTSCNSWSQWWQCQIGWHSSRWV